MTSDLLLNFVFKLYHKTCEQFYCNFGIYEKSPNSFLPGLSRSIINQFRFHSLLCLRLASVHLPHPFHLVFSFQLLGHAVSLCQWPHDQLHAVSCRFIDFGTMLFCRHRPIHRVFFFANYTESCGILWRGGGVLRRCAATPHPPPSGAPSPQGEGLRGCALGGKADGVQGEKKGSTRAGASLYVIRWPRYSNTPVGRRIGR